MSGLHRASIWDIPDNGPVQYVSQRATRYSGTRPNLKMGQPCHYCKSRIKKLTVDHIIPRSRGGTNNYWNLVAACARCNGDKANRLPTCKCEHCQEAIDRHWQWLMEQRGNRAELMAKVEPLYINRWR